MKSVLSVNDHDAVLDVVQHLRRHFEWEGGCAACGIVAPLRGCIFTVVEPIKTCHEKSGHGLDTQNALPPGTYKVLGHEQHRDGASHWLELEDCKTKQRVQLCHGYSKSICMDWRGILPHTAEAEETGIP